MAPDYEPTEEMSQESIDDFDSWLDSIEFVDKNGIIVRDIKLVEDVSSDPEGDRSG